MTSAGTITKLGMTLRGNRMHFRALLGLARAPSLILWTHRCFTVAVRVHCSRTAETLSCLVCSAKATPLELNQLGVCALAAL